MTNDIVIEGLIKSFVDFPVLKGIDLNIVQGEIVGIIGPNGAGKTTLLSILAGILSADSGLVLIKGCVPERLYGGAVASLVSLSSDRYGFFDYLTGREIIMAHGYLQHPANKDIESRTEELLDVFELAGAADHSVYEYSYGMRKKLSLASALVVCPNVLLLDEPFDGLDPLAQLRLTAILEQTAASGNSVLLTSHDLGIVERVCGRVLILHNGMLQAEIVPNSAELSQEATATNSLEEVMWKVVGKPEIKPLSWLTELT